MAARMSHLNVIPNFKGHIWGHCNGQSKFGVGSGLGSYAPVVIVEETSSVACNQRYQEQLGTFRIEPTQQRGHRRRLLPN